MDLGGRLQRRGKWKSIWDPTQLGFVRMRGKSVMTGLTWQGKKEVCFCSDWIYMGTSYTGNPGNEKEIKTEVNQCTFFLKKKQLCLILRTKNTFCLISEHFCFHICVKSHICKILYIQQIVEYKLYITNSVLSTEFCNVVLFYILTRIK